MNLGSELIDNAQNDKTKSAMRFLTGFDRGGVYPQTLEASELPDPYCAPRDEHVEVRLPRLCHWTELRAAARRTGSSATSSDEPEATRLPEPKLPAEQHEPVSALRCR